jgi:hypothetical protein
MVVLGGERINSNANGGKENGITTGLPPDESSGFIVVIARN